MRYGSSHDVRHRRLGLHWVAAAVASALGFGIGAATAQAGTYTAWYCRDGADRGVGLSDWAEERSGVGYVTTTMVNCPSSGDGGSFGALVLPDAGNDPTLVSDGYLLNAPPTVRLDALRLLWVGSASASGQVLAVKGDDVQQTALATYTNTSFGALPGAGGTDAVYTLGGARWVALRARCVSACQSGSEPFASVSILRVALSISDLEAPRGTASGTLLVDPVLKGLEAVSVEGRDDGAGVYQAQVVVDGEVRASAPVGDAPCRDVDTSNSDPFEFSTARPCPVAANATVALDTSQLAEDVYHRVVVQVVDAAGNVTKLADRVVAVDNAPLPAGFFDAASRRFTNPVLDLTSPRRPNGSVATTDARLRLYLPVTRRTHGRRARRITQARLKRTVTFQSRPRLRGVLTTADGKPIAGAAIWIASRIDGEDWRISGKPRLTNSRGRVGLRLPPGVPSRQLNLVYFPYSDSHDQVVGRPVALKVRAGVTLRVNKDAARNGQRVTFRGRVIGRVPTPGATVALQAKVGRRFRTFRQVRAASATRGRFVARYRFTATTSTTRYQFRALVMAQAGLPFETGTSQVISVLVAA